MKIKYLTEFHETALIDREWKLEGVGEGDERILLERFSSVSTVFQSLSEGSQEVCVYCPISHVRVAPGGCDHAMLRGNISSSNAPRMRDMFGGVRYYSRNRRPSRAGSSCQGFIRVPSFASHVPDERT